MTKLTGQGVLETVTEDDEEGQALTELVGSGTGSGSEDTSQLGEHPVLGREKALHVQLGSTGHAGLIYFEKGNEKQKK